MVQGSWVTNWEVGTPSSINLENAAAKLQMNRVVRFRRTQRYANRDSLLEEHVLALSVLESILLECLVAD